MGEALQHMKKPARGGLIHWSDSEKLVAGVGFEPTTFRLSA